MSNALCIGLVIAVFMPFHIFETIDFTLLNTFEVVFLIPSQTLVTALLALFAAFEIVLLIPFQIFVAVDLTLLNAFEVTFFMLSQALDIADLILFRTELIRFLIAFQTLVIICFIESRTVETMLLIPFQIVLKRL